MGGTQPCSYAGRLSVPEEGRWFVYATFGTPSGLRETWLPVEVTDGTRTSATRDLYQPPTPPNRKSQPLVGRVLLAFAAVLVVGTLRAVSAAGDPQPGGADLARDPG